MDDLTYYNGWGEGRSALAKKIHGGWNNFAGCGPLVGISHGIQHSGVHTEDSGHGYSLGTIGWGHIGWHRYFERCFEGDNPVVGVREKGAAGRTLAGKKD